MGSVTCWKCHVTLQRVQRSTNFTDARFFRLDLNLVILLLLSLLFGHERGRRY
jgi:hypothetical protein